MKITIEVEAENLDDLQRVLRGKASLTDLSALMRAVANRQKIEGIKIVRAMTGAGLADSKAVMDILLPSRRWPDDEAS